MTAVYPLFICCNHGELTFDVLPVIDCHWHTAGWSKTKKITSEMRKAAVLGQKEWQKKCNSKKVQL